MAQVEPSPAAQLQAGMIRRALYLAEGVRHRPRLRLAEHYHELRHGRRLPGRLFSYPAAAVYDCACM
jgi:hypothetical protein